MSAPLLGPLSHPVHRFSLGAFEVTTILDGALQMGVKPPFLLDKDEDEIARISAAANLPATGLENGFSLTLVNTGRKLVLFDTGFGGFGHDRGAGLLKERLRLAGYSAEDIDIVAFTHVHPDHIGGLVEDGSLAFPNAELMIGRQEFDTWMSGDKIPEQRAQNREMFLNVVAPFADRFTYLEDGDQITGGISAEAAFGHSLGHMMFRLESDTAQALVWGDLANHYVYSVSHPDSPVGFDDDKPAAIATRKRVLDMVATDGLLVSGFHMPFPAIGYVERSSDIYRWVPASYQTRL